MFKKMLAVLIGALTICAACALCAGAETSGDYEYEILDNGTVEITGYTGSATDLIIPSTIGGKKVTSIGESAFLECNTITSVDIPNSVVEIGSAAFMDCSSLSKVNVPNSIVKMADSVFSRTPFLTNQSTFVKYAGNWIVDYYDNDSYQSQVTIRDGIERVAPFSFSYAHIGELILPDSIEYLGDYAFNESNIETLVLSNGISKISEGCFINAYIQSIKIPDSVKIIEDLAFWNCNSFTEIKLPEGVTSIGEGAFSRCVKLTSINIPDSVISIGANAFFGTRFLYNQTTTVKYGGNWVIGCDSNATSVSIKSGTIGIADCAFYDCSSLTSITIPDSVTSIGDYAFDNCSDDLVIYGHSGSTAEKYAKDNEIKFVATDLPTVGGISKFSLDSRGVNSLKLSWSKASGATGYELEIQKNGKWSKAATISSGATVSYTITGLSAGTYYPLRVRAFVKSGGNTVYSAWKTGSVNTSPSNMTGFKLASRGVNSVKLSWTKNTSASGYQVGVYKGGKWVSYTVKGSGTTSYTVSGLSAGTKYNVRVRAYKTNGSSTIYGAWKTGSANTSPSNMTGFKLASRGVNSVKLSWTKNTSASGYQVGVYKGGKWVSYTVKGNGTTSYTVSGLSAGTKYNVRVRAYKTNGSSTIYGAWKTGSVITAPSNMTGFKLKSKTTGSLTLQWSKNSSATGYQLQIQKNGKWVSYTVKGNSTTSCAIKSLSKNTKYNLRIRAYKIIDSSTIYGAWKNGSASTKK